MIITVIVATLTLAFGPQIVESTEARSRQTRQTKSWMDDVYYDDASYADDADASYACNSTTGQCTQCSLEDILGQRPGCDQPATEIHDTMELCHDYCPSERKT